jgi:hypothetical protein
LKTAPWQTPNHSVNASERSKPHLWEVEAGQLLLVEPHVPAHGDVLAALRLLHGLVVVSLQLDQRLEHSLHVMMIKGNTTGDLDVYSSMQQHVERQQFALVAISLQRLEQRLHMMIKTGHEEAEAVHSATNKHNHGCPAPPSQYCAASS